MCCVPPSYLFLQILVIISFSFSDGLPLQFPGFYLYLASSRLRKIQNIMKLFSRFSPVRFLLWTCFDEYLLNDINIIISNCNVIAVLVFNFWLNKYLKVAIWKFTVNFHQFWMLSFEEIFQHQIFINYKLPSCSLQVEKYWTYNCYYLMACVLQGVHFRANVLQVRFRRFRLQNYFIHRNCKIDVMNQPWPTGGPELTSLVWLIGRWRSEESEGRSGNWTTSKYIFFQLNFNPDFTYL